MKIIHVDDSRFAQEEIKEQIPQIVPDAELHCFDRPDPALAFAETEGYDVLLTEIELWLERLGGIRLAKAIKEINPASRSFSSPSAANMRSPASCPGFPSAASSRSPGHRRSWRRRSKPRAVRRPATRPM